MSTKDKKSKTSEKSPKNQDKKNQSKSPKRNKSPDTKPKATSAPTTTTTATATPAMSDKAKEAKKEEPKQETKKDEKQTDDGKLKVVLMLGSVRPGRQGSLLTDAIIPKLSGQGHHVTLIDAREEKLPVLECAYHHYAYYGKTAPEQLTRLAKSIEEADAIVIVDGEYNHSPTPGMLNLIDHFGSGQYKGKPAGIASYSIGGISGARSAYVLRNTLGEVGLVTIPTLFSLATISAAIKDGKFTEEKNDQRCDKFLSELLWYARALKSQRGKEDVPR